MAARRRSEVPMLKSASDPGSHPVPAQPVRASTMKRRHIPWDVEQDRPWRERHGHDTTYDSPARRMDLRPQGPAGKGKGVHPAARRVEPAAPGASLGEGREGIRLRRPGRRGDAGRSLRPPEPAHRLPLHVRPGLGRGLQVMLLPCRPLRARRRPSGATRRDPGHGLTRAAGEDRGVQGAHGLAVQVGVVASQRLQPGLPGDLRTGRRGRREGLLQLCRDGVPDDRGPGDQRVLQGRRGRRLSHLLVLRAGGWTRSSAPTICSTSCPRAGTRRACVSVWNGYGTTTGTGRRRDGKASAAP